MHPILSNCSPFSSCSQIKNWEKATLIISAIASLAVIGLGLYLSGRVSPISAFYGAGAGGFGITFLAALLLACLRSKKQSPVTPSTHDSLPSDSPKISASHSNLPKAISAPTALPNISIPPLTPLQEPQSAQLSPSSSASTSLLPPPQLVTPPMHQAQSIIPPPPTAAQVLTSLNKTNSPSVSDEVNSTPTVLTLSDIVCNPAERTSILNSEIEQVNKKVDAAIQKRNPQEGLNAFKEFSEKLEKFNEDNPDLSIKNNELQNYTTYKDKIVPQLTGWKNILSIQNSNEESEIEKILAQVVNLISPSNEMEIPWGFLFVSINDAAKHIATAPFSKETEDTVNKAWSAIGIKLHSPLPKLTFVRAKEKNSINSESNAYKDLVKKRSEVILPGKSSSTIPISPRRELQAYPEHFIRVLVEDTIDAICKASSYNEVLAILELFDKEIEKGNQSLKAYALENSTDKIKLQATEVDQDNLLNRWLKWKEGLKTLLKAWGELQNLFNNPSPTVEGAISSLETICSLLPQKLPASTQNSFNEKKKEVCPYASYGNIYQNLYASLVHGQFTTELITLNNKEQLEIALNELAKKLNATPITIEINCSAAVIHDGSTAQNLYKDQEKQTELLSQNLAKQLQQEEQIQLDAELARRLARQ